MEPMDIARVLEEMADLLEIAEANPFEIQAYRNAARTVQGAGGDPGTLRSEDALTALPGIGKKLASVIAELARTGRSREHRRLRGELPSGVLDLRRLPGLGPRRVRALIRELGVTGLDDLGAAAASGRVRELKGFGPRTEERILRSIERVRERGSRPSGTRPRSSPPEPVSIPSPELPPEDPAPARVRVGTSGYAYKEWKGSFYPEDLPATRFLEHYASRFETVEINNTFYRFPAPHLFESWREATPPGFRFAVKANQRITHRARLRDVGEVTGEFVDRCRGLRERMGPVLVQLPPNFKRDDARLDGFLGDLPPGVRIAMEFRHPSWFEEEVFRKLGDAGVSLCLSEGDGLATPRVLTASFVYARLRRDDYTGSDLAAWHDFARDQRAEGRDVFLYLKHDDTSPEERLRMLEGGSRVDQPNAPGGE